MIRALVLAAVLCAPARADGGAEGASVKLKDLEDCVATLAYFRDGLSAKTGALDKEFNGRIPSAFSPLLALKRNRIAKQQSACARRGADVERALAGLNDDALRGRLNLSLKALASLH